MEEPSRRTPLRTSGFHKGNIGRFFSRKKFLEEFFHIFYFRVRTVVLPPKYTHMKLAYRYLLASLACFVLLILTLFVGVQLVIPFESFAAEIGFMSILFLGSVLFLCGGIGELYDEWMERF